MAKMKLSHAPRLVGWRVGNGHPLLDGYRMQPIDTGMTLWTRMEKT